MSGFVAPFPFCANRVRKTVPQAAGKRLILQLTIQPIGTMFVKRIILRFDGVYSYARLSVNGHYVREHHGGFTRWETDMTRRVRPGRRNELWLEVTDRLDESSYASGYVRHPVGGILRGVTLFALPQSYVCEDT